jgi:hypothetical protein
LLNSASEQLREGDLQDVGDLAGGVDCDVDPATFEQAHVGLGEIAQFLDDAKCGQTKMLLLRSIEDYVMAIFFYSAA